MNEFEKFLDQPFTEIMEKILSGDAEILINTYAFFAKPKFRVSQTGFSRRDINVWRKENLLPKSLEDGKWNQFSITECVWLRFVGMLKKFGVKHEDIRRIKVDMFPTELNQLKERFLCKDLPHVPKEYTDNVEGFFRHLDNTPELEFPTEFYETYFSFWNHLVIACCKLHLNYAAIIDKDANHMFINIGASMSETHSVLLHDLMRTISRSSFLLINIADLCKDFFENEKVLIDSGYYFGLMNEFEQKIITEVRTGKYKMITVKIDDGSITHIKLTKQDRENEDMLRKLSRLFKTNEFKDIELTTRNGKIIKYSETDIVKLNTK